MRYEYDHSPDTVSVTAALMCDDLCESDLSPLQLYSPSDTESALKLNSAVVVVVYWIAECLHL